MLEVWKRTTDATPAADGCAEDNGESNFFCPKSESNRESRIERSAGVIRERAVNVKWSACDQRAVQCKLIPFVAESVLVILKSPICRCRMIATEEMYRRVNLLQEEYEAGLDREVKTAMAERAEYRKGFRGITVRARTLSAGKVKAAGSQNTKAIE
ncbi:hypothetical protein D917_10161, partial [Trichinella nativa]